MSKTIETILTADSSILRAEFAKAEKMSEEYERKVARGQSAARTAALDNVRALQLEATGRKAAAEAMRQEISLKAEAARLSKATGMSEEGAISVLRRKLELEQRITEQKARSARIAPGGGSALPDMPLTPAYLQTMEKAAARTQELRRQTLAAGRSGQNGAMGFLAFSQAVEDAQYGIRGVLNNIPQMIMGFGGTMGLAGALSLAAVAGVALYPVLKRLYGAADTERLKKSADAWGEIFDAGVKASGQAARERDIFKETEGYVIGIRNATSDRVTLNDGLLRNMEVEARMRGEALNLANELAEAERRAAAAKGQATGGFAEAGRGREMEGLEADLASRKAIADAAFQEAERLRQNSRSLAAGYGADLDAQAKAIQEMTLSLAAAEANVAAAKKEQEDKGLKGADLASARIAERASIATRDRIEQELEILKSKRDALAALAEQQDAEAKAGADAMEAKIQAATEESQAIERLIAQRKQLFNLQRDTEKAEKEAAAAAAKSPKSDFAERLAANQEAEEKARSQTGARTDFAQEMAVLALQAQGRESAAAALEKEIALRREAVGMAKEMGITEEQAINALRRREEMIRRGEAVKVKGQREDKARSRTDFARGNKVGFSRDSTVGFARDGLRNAAAEKAALKDPGAKDRGAAASYYEKSLEQGEMLVKIFDKLGIA
jgi:hypothetical protein